MKRLYDVVDNYFETIDSDIKAYLLGFFLADGTIELGNRCKNSYRLSIAVSDIDFEIIKLYKKEICPNNNIKINNNTKGAINRKPVHSIRWTSTKMKEDLEKYNIKRNKTKDIDFEFPFNLIDSKYIFSFIRGFFDGDGHLSYEYKKISFTFAFYATSKNFLIQLGKIFEKEFSVKYIIDQSQRKNMILYCLRFHSNQKRREFIEKLYNKMYNNSKFSLERKRYKFESYLNTVLSIGTKKSIPV